MEKSGGYENNSSNTEKFEQKCESIFEAIEQRFVKINDRLMTLLPTKASDLSTDKPLQKDFVTNILKNRVAQLVKQLADKNTLINFLSSQLTDNIREIPSTKEVFNSTGKNCCNCNNRNNRNESVNKCDSR